MTNDVFVRNIPDDVHKRLRLEAAEQRISVAQLIRDILADHARKAARP